MKRRKGHRVIEWSLMAVFMVFLIAWTFVVYPLFDDLTSRYDSFISYGIYTLAFGLLGYCVGSTFKKGFPAFMVTISFSLMLDIIGPPRVISYDSYPSTELLHMWGSDTFLYTLWSHLSMSPQATWILTYVLTPIIGFFIVIYYLSGEKLAKKLKSVFEG